VGGILIRPDAFGVATDAPHVQYLAEFSVVFLMFSIGLEFSFAKLRAMRRIVFGLGVSRAFVSTLVAMAAGFPISFFVPFGWQASLSLGGAMAMSSTAIVPKL